MSVNLGKSEFLFLIAEVDRAIPSLLGWCEKKMRPDIFRLLV